MKVDIPEDTVKFLKELANEIKGQDNRATAAPYFYVIQGLREYAAADGCGDETGYYDPDVCASYTEDEMQERYEEWLYEQVDEDEEPTKADRLLHTFQEYLNAFDIQTYDIGYHEVEENVFLTEKGVRQHMDLNRHNYRHYNKLTEKGYVKHAFRNPEMEKLMKAIMVFGDVQVEDEDVITKGGVDRAFKRCKCSMCETISECTPTNDFYTAPDDDGGLLYCESCILRRDRKVTNG